MPLIPAAMAEIDSKNTGLLIGYLTAPFLRGLSSPPPLKKNDTYQIVI